MQTKPIIVTMFWSGIGLAFHNNVISVLLHVHVKVAGQHGHLAMSHWWYGASHLSKQRQRHWKHKHIYNFWSSDQVNERLHSFRSHQIKWMNACIPKSPVRSGEWMSASLNHLSDQVNESLHPFTSHQTRWVNVHIPPGVTKSGEYPLGVTRPGK